MKISNNIPTPNLSGLKEAALNKATQAGQFLSRSVTSLGNSLKSGFTATYNFAKSISKKVFDSPELTAQDKAALAKAKQDDRQYSIDRMKDSGLL
jgi:hypothetical protein